MTAAEAIERAIRLLETAQDQTDRELMERFNHLADSWIEVAALLTERERALM